MVFAARTHQHLIVKYEVSIPSRGLWFLRQNSGCCAVLELWFQSLVGVYGFCGAERLSEI